jgi:hypothetical protein
MGLPVLLFTVLATLDVTAVLQARSALQQATTTSLRCVYPVDGSCAATSSDRRDQLFDYFEIPASGDDQYVYRRVDFSGTASFFMAPKRELADFNARLLDNVHFDIPQATYHVSGSVTGYEVTQNSRELSLIATTPFLDGDSLRSPSFRRSSSGGSFPAARTGGSQAPSNLEDYESYLQLSAHDRSVGLGSNEVSPGPWTTAYSFSVVQPAAPENCVGSGCAQLTNSETRISFHLEGSGSSSISGGCGKVELRLVNASGNSHDLGGQAFEILTPSGAGASADLNFYPRGIPETRAKDEWSDVKELIDHGEVTVSYRHTYRLQIRMTRNSGEHCDAGAALSWSASDVTFFLPLLEETVKTNTCDTIAVGGVLEEGAVCKKNSAAISGLIGQPQVNLARPISKSISREIANAYSEIDAWDRALQEEFSVELAPSLVVSLPRTVTLLHPDETATFSLACPANHGVSEEPRVDASQTPASAIRNSAQALTDCPPALASHPALARPAALGVQAQNPRWSERSQALGHPPFAWTKWNCSSTAPGYANLPQELQAYPQAKLTWVDRASSSVPNFEIVPTGRELEGNPTEDPNDPETIKATNPLYQCDEISIGRFVYNDSNRALDRSSLFVGIRDNVDACSTGQILRAAAENSQIPEAQRLLANMFFRPGAVVEKDRIETSTPPQDTCVAYRLREGESQGMGSKVPGGPFAEGVVPLACQGDNAHCRRVFAHFGGGQAGETKVLSARAEQLGENELFAAAPWTARTCGEATCGQVTVEENIPSPGMITSTASTKLRLTTLLGKEITLSHSHRERLEVQLAR